MRGAAAIRSWRAGHGARGRLRRRPRDLRPRAVARGADAAPALAGSWYPEGRAHLVAGAHFLMRLAAPAPTPPAQPAALVVPHAGWSYSGLAAATAFRLLKPGDFERVVVLAPSHQGSFRGYALDDATAYRTPIGDVPLCDGALAALQGGEARVVGGVTEKEHAVEIELPFLQAALGRFCLVPVLAGDTDEALERAFAERLAKLDDGRTLFVFSSDFSHYGPRFDFQPFGALSPAVREKVRAMDDRGADLLAREDARGFRAYLPRPGTRSAAATASPPCWSCCRASHRGRRRAPRPLRLGRHPGDAGRQLGLLRGDGLPARGARPAPLRPAARGAAAARGRAARHAVALAEEDGGASCGSPAPPHDPLLRDGTTSAGSSRRGRPAPTGRSARVSSSRSTARTRRRSARRAGSAAASASRSPPSRSTTAPCRPRSTRRCATRASSR